MGCTYQFTHIWRSPLLPNKLCDKIVFSENLITNHTKQHLFSVINANKNNSIIDQQLFQKFQPGIHHAKQMCIRDRIGDMPMDLQVKLLRAIQNKEITRVGGTKPIKLDIRIIAATNSDLKRKISEGTFRQDLYYRLNVIPVSYTHLDVYKRQEQYRYP